VKRCIVKPMPDCINALSSARRISNNPGMGRALVPGAFNYIVAYSRTSSHHGARYPIDATRRWSSLVRRIFAERKRNPCFGIAFTWKRTRPKRNRRGLAAGK
jgi:hypothetical protein